MTKVILVTLAGAALIFLGFCVWVWRAWRDPGLVVPVEPRDDAPPEP